MFSCTVSSSMRLKLWNTNPNMPLRNSFRFDSLQEDTSFPSSRYCPEDGLSNRPRMWSNVDLPQPEGPMTATNSPCPISIFTLSKAQVSTSSVLNTFVNSFT